MAQYYQDFGVVMNRWANFRLELGRLNSAENIINAAITNIERDALQGRQSGDGIPIPDRNSLSRQEYRRKLRELNKSNKKV